MIVDVHTHTPTHRDAIPPEEMVINDKWRPDKAVAATRTWKDYMEAMKPVDKAIVFGIHPEPGKDPLNATGIPGGRNVNDATAEFVKAHPDKLIGFASVHPKQKDALEEIERAVYDLGLKGLKLGPNYQNFEPLSEEARRIYAKAEKMGLPILFHQGTSPVREAPVRYAHPLIMDEIALNFPELRIVMAHMGHPWQADTIAVIRKHPHVYADISGLFYRPWSFYNCMRLATEWNVLHKLLFGSDFPVTTPEENMRALLHINDIVEGTALPRVPEEELLKIIHRNALELLGIDDSR